MQGALTFPDMAAVSASILPVLRSRPAGARGKIEFQEGLRAERRVGADMSRAAHTAYRRIGSQICQDQDRRDVYVLSRSGSGRRLVRAPEPPASPSALREPHAAHGSDGESADKKPVRDVLGYHEKDDTNQNQDTGHQTRHLARQQQNRPVRAVLRLVTPILLGRVGLLPPGHNAGKPSLVPEQSRTGSARQLRPNLPL